MSDTLPGIPGKALSSIWDELSAAQREALRPHLLGGTGADWLSTLLTTNGFPVGKTAINDYRRRLRQAGVQV